MATGLAVWGLEPSGWMTEQVAIGPTQVTVELRTITAWAKCPRCGQASTRVHSHYRRTLSDLPLCGKPLELRINARRFFCDNADCTQEVFAERLAGLACAHARRTDRLLQGHRRIGLALGGEAGARLAGRLGMATSGDTILRIVHQTPLPPVTTPVVLGVDDWALCRGQRYGTILCDLEHHRPIDLLPERSSLTLSSWLTDHPGVQVISRDRGGDYARGAAAGAPEAVQVADRWHLLHNLHGALVRVADRCHSLIRLAAQEVACPKSPLPEPATRRTLTSSQRLSQEHRERRLARYQQVVELHRQGLSLRKIAKRLRMGQDSARRFAHAQTFPERAQHLRWRQVTPHLDYLRRRWEEGCHNARTLTQELATPGKGPSYDSVRRLVAPWRSRPWQRDPPATAGVSPASIPSPPVLFPSSNRVAWLVQRAEAELDDDEQALVESLYQHCPDLRVGADLAGEFASLVHDRRRRDLDTWIALAQEPPSVPEMANFARGLGQDLAAVQAALELEWSNGQVEGQINRLKLVKRQMYGRAGFALLRRRFLETG